MTIKCLNWASQQPTPDCYEAQFDATPLGSSSHYSGHFFGLSR